MLFSEELEKYSWDEITKQIYAKTEADVARALTQEHLQIEDFMALISPAAEHYLEEMAVRSRMYTQQRFGKTISMYIPMYITNSCTNFCVYCGFNHNNPINRIILTDEEIVEECNQYGNFLYDKPVLTNVKKLSDEEIVEFVRKQVLSKRQDRT